MSYNSFKKFINKQHKIKSEPISNEFREMVGFFPKEYKTENEKEEITQAKIQEDLDLLEEQKDKVLNSTNL